MMKPEKRNYTFILFFLIFTFAATGSCNLTLPYLGEYYYNPKGTDTSQTTYNSADGCYTSGATSSITSFFIELARSTTHIVKYNQPNCVEKYSSEQVVRALTIGGNVTSRFYNPLSNTLGQNEFRATEYNSTINEHTLTCHSATCSQDMANFFAFYSGALPACNFTAADFPIGTAANIFSCMKGIAGLQVANNTAPFNPYSATFYSILYYDESNRRLHFGLNHAETADNQSGEVFDGSSPAERYRYMNASTWYEKL